MECGDRDILFSELPEHSGQISYHVKERYANSLKDRYGTNLLSLTLKKVSISPEDEELIRKTRRMAAMRDPAVAAQVMLQQQEEAMRLAKLGETYRKWKGASPAYETAVKCAAEKTTKEEVWTCSCGASGTGRFCSECGVKRPETWTCLSCAKT